MRATGKLLGLVAVALAIGGGALFAEKVEDETLKDARVGDWIELRMVMPPELNMTSSTRQSILEVTKDEVVVEAVGTTAMNGKPLPAQKMPPQRRARFIEKAAQPSEETTSAKANQSREKVLAADGKEYDCLVIESEVGGKKARTFICKELPLGGLVRSELDGKATLEMIGWGRGPGK